jgi:hypothetical protein
MSGLLGGQGLIEPLPIYLFAHTGLNSVTHICGNEGVRHLVGGICFISNKISRMFCRKFKYTRPFTLLRKKYGHIIFFPNIPHQTFVE